MSQHILAEVDDLRTFVFRAIWLIRALKNTMADFGTVSFFIAEGW